MIRIARSFAILIAAVLPSLLPVGGCQMARDNAAADAERARHPFPNYSVVLPDQPSETEKLAAEELSRFLGKAFTKNMLLNGSSEPVKFYVGFSRAAAEAGFPARKFADGEFAVELRGRSVLLAGNDDGAPLAWNSATGTLSAVYHFLQAYAGFEFFFPGDSGTYVPQNPEINLDEGKHSPSPSFAVRGFVTDCDDIRPEEGLLFQKRMLCSLPDWMRHCTIYSFDDWRDRFWESNPEYFAEINGKKVFHKWLYSNPCFSSEAAAHQAARDVSAILDKNPGLRGVELFQDIPYRPCMCERCRSSAARIKGGQNDSSEEYFGFVAAVAGEVLAGHPDRVVIAHTKEYRWPSTLRPVDPRVVIHMLADRDRIYEPGKLDDILAQLRAWRRNGNPVVCKSYERHPHFKNYPLINPRHTVQYARAVHGLALGFHHSDATKGIPYAYCALNNYVQGRILFDVDADQDELIEKFVAFSFPGAEREMGGFFREMEELWASKKDHAYDAPADWYSPENLRKPMELLEAAAAKVSKDSVLFQPLRKAMDELYKLSLEKAPYYDARRPKDVTPPEAPGPVALDGTISPEEWRGAAEYPLMPMRFDPNSKEPPQLGKVLMMRDNENLYFGLVAYECRVKDLTRNCTKNGEGDIFSDDSFEVMIAHGREPYPYYQTMINSIGVWRQLRCLPGRISEDSTEMKFNTAASTHSDRYEVELAVPLGQFPPDSFTHPWLFNVFRNRYCLPPNYAYGDLKCTQWSGISIMGESFHMVGTYNRLHITPPEKR